jgi:hypothetical protein
MKIHLLLFANNDEHSIDGNYYDIWISIPSTEIMLKDSVNKQAGLKQHMKCCQWTEE